MLLPGGWDLLPPPPDVLGYFLLDVPQVVLVYVVPLQRDAAREADKPTEPEDSAGTAIPQGETQHRRKPGMGDII